MSEELKPCPFCGGSPSYYVGANDSFIECDECHSTSPQYNNSVSNGRQILISLWNTRTPTEAKELARLKSDIAQITDANTALQVSYYERGEEITKLESDNAGYKRMLTMSGQNIGLRLLNAEQEIDGLKAKLKRLGDEERFHKPWSYLGQEWGITDYLQEINLRIDFANSEVE